MQARALPLLIHRGSPTCLLCFRPGIAPSGTSRVSQLLSPRCRIPSYFLRLSRTFYKRCIRGLKPNPYFAAYASLSGTITHGMFSVLLQPTTRRFVETVVAMRVPNRVFK